MDERQRERLSRLLSLVLRHKPDQFGLELDAHGYAALEDLIEALAHKYPDVQEEEVLQIVDGTEKRRFELVDGRIRARYGHSFPIDLGLDPIDPPESLYHATVPTQVATITTEGLHPADRQFVHLSLDSEIAMDVARNHTDTPALFSGDTLFNAGAGNCHGGGHPEELYETFVSQLDRLPATTEIYPGHDYMTNNLAFTMDREPDNQAAKRLLEELEGSYDPAKPLVTSLEVERDINTFFRLTSPTVIEHLRESFSDLPDQPAPKEVFLKLRELRNSW